MSLPGSASSHTRLIQCDHWYLLLRNVWWTNLVLSVRAAKRRYTPWCKVLLLEKGIKKSGRHISYSPIWICKVIFLHDFNELSKQTDTRVSLEVSITHITGPDSVITAPADARPSAGTVMTMEFEVLCADDVIRNSQWYLEKYRSTSSVNKIHGTRAAVYTLKLKDSQFNNFVVTVGTISCDTDNLRCHLWRQRCQIDGFCFQCNGWRTRPKAET